MHTPCQCITAFLPLIVAGIILLGLLVWGFKNPLVWRMLAVVGMGTGVGFLVWGIMLAAMRESPALGSPAGIIAAGAGVLVSTTALFVISFCSGRPARKE
jgi:Na+-translocating ferredoxin:NAD+ oxidoreductase RnfA subunit